MTNEETILRAILSTIGRQTFSPNDLRALISPTGNQGKQIAAYNLCDGSRSQAEIAKKLGLDASNFSKTVSRWVELGIVFKLGTGSEQRLLHLYAIPEQPGGKEKKPNA